MNIISIEQCVNKILHKNKYFNSFTLNYELRLNYY